MAIVKIFPANLDGSGPFSAFDQPTLVSNSGRLAKYTDADGDVLLLKGTGFQFESGELVGGTITSMTAVAFSGAKYGSITEAHFNAAHLPPLGFVWAPLVHEAMSAGNDTLFGSAGVDNLGGFGGKDVIKGLAGADSIAGGKGNDRLTGGGGGDDFQFRPSEGRDVITDFQSEGELLDHDQLWVRAGSYEARKSGRDLIVETDTGIVITLLDVKKSELDPEDVVFVPF